MILKVSKCIFQLYVNRPLQLSVPINSQWFSTKMSKYLSEVPEVDIDGKGVFKYMLLNIHDKATDDYKPVVRGYLSAAWHDDVFEQTKEQVKKYSDLEVKSLGGGRIQHDPEIKSIRVYGYSQQITLLPTQSHH
ncbi:PREDICTED: sex-regulated protein janus-A-like isoform X2 [Polistes dominula]|uniref:Sex-regulated protein janus-A-like isoform X2 n=1 Tax=Polistes dominula TaxID=743375 RepID=A0ABM1IRB6_POLDO|nr:PREDICTED: sex-regulated protein janus-A-like isoform X2 [Polistes dominula]